MQGKGREAEMTSKSSTSNGEEEDDCGTFVPWLDLIFGVDNTSTDIILSNEELLTERYLKAGTLPAILRRLTLIETTSQSQIWAFLLHLRSFVVPRFIFSFLVKRFSLSPDEVDHYASTLRSEIFEPNVGDIDDPSDLKWTCIGPNGPEILEENRHVIGPQYFWLATSSELSKHPDELSKRSLSLFCERDDLDHLMLESYSSIQLGVLLFLETWLQHFPEDFLLVTARVNSKFCRNAEKSIDMSNDLEFIHEFPGASAKNDSNTDDGKLPSIQWTDDSDDALLTADLIAFIREFSTCSMFLFLGGRVSKGQEKSSSDLSLKRGYSSEIITTWIPQNSQLKLQFPCISSILEIVVAEDSLCSLVNQVITQPSPKSDLAPEKNRLSMRSSFFEKFIDSQLSDILEFEDDTIKSESGDFLGDYATQLITSTLGPETRLSNGCADSENFSLQIPCSGGFLSCIISSSLVSALTATAIELRSKFPLSCITYSQCQRYLERKWASEDHFLLGNNIIEDPCDAKISDSSPGYGSHNPENMKDPPKKPISISLPLLGKITKDLQIQREKALVDVYVAYSECAIALCAVELQIAQDYAASDSILEVPLRIFSTTIDRQIIGFSGSKRKGLDQVAQLLRLHRVHSDLDSESNSSDHETSSSQGNKSPRKSMFSFLRRRSVPDENITFRASSLSISSSYKVPPSVKLPHLSHLSPEVISQCFFLSFDEKILANNLTLRFHYLFCTIPIYEFSIDYSYTKNQKHTPMLNRFRLESEKLQEFVGNQILLQSDLMVRAEIIIQVIRVAEVLAKLRSHHVLMMLIFALQSHSIHRLKTTWAVVNARIPGRWDILQDLVGFGGQKLTSNFCSRQSVEGVSEDIRNQLKLIVPTYVQMPENVSKFLNSNDVKTLQIANHPQGISLSFGVLASREAYPTKGGITSSTEQTSVVQPTNRSCSYADLQKSTQESSHWLQTLQDSLPTSYSHENVLHVKEHFSHPDIFKQPSKFVLKRRFSYPMSNKEISSIKHAISGRDIVDITQGMQVNNSENGRMRTQSEVPKHFDKPPRITSHNGIKEENIAPVKNEKHLQYRQYLFQKSFNENRPVHGTVRSDGLGEAGGTPKPSGKPCLPYVNGLLGRIIRLKEIPSFIKTELRQPTGEPVSCYFCAKSPGNSPSDPDMLMINFGKLRAISNLLILIRSSQMTPYKFDVDFEIQYQCSKLPLYHGEDAMWERSKMLE